MLGFPLGLLFRMALVRVCRSQRARTGSIFQTHGGGRALLVKPDAAARWVSAGLVNLEDWQTFPFGADSYIVDHLPNAAEARIRFSL